MEDLIFFIIPFWIANIFFCAWLAGEKNRSMGWWTLLAVFFGFLTLLVLIGAPVKLDDPEKEKLRTEIKNVWDNTHLKKEDKSQ